jgi:hypothetical protein
MKTRPAKLWNVLASVPRSKKALQVSYLSILDKY